MSDQPLDTIAPDVPPRVEQLSKRRARGDVRPPGMPSTASWARTLTALPSATVSSARKSSPRRSSRSTRIRWNLIDEDGTFGRE